MAVRPRVAKVYSCFNDGMQGVLSEIEVSVSPGIPTFSVIGLCDSSIRESQGRLRSALAGAGFRMPKGHVTVSISPAYLRKSGSGFDLAMAAAILFASGQLHDPGGMKVYAEGELTLTGAVKGTPGAALRLNRLRDEKMDIKLIPKEEVLSARCTGTSAQAVGCLEDLTRLFSVTGYVPLHYLLETLPEEDSEYIDISLLKGQEKTKRALIISASGFHNLLLLGSPGSGKTMAGRILTGILPPLARSEISAAYAVSEAVGVLPGAKLTGTRPCRYIGPQVTTSKLYGSSVKLTPGELTLANNGVLFADEILEYKSEVIESLRQPLEERVVRLTRNGRSYEFPANFIFVGTGNPCKCGMYYEPGHKCRCSPGVRQRYLNKLSGPFLERIDLFSEMHAISGSAMEEMYGAAGRRTSGHVLSLGLSGDSGGSAAEISSEPLREHEAGFHLCAKNGESIRIRDEVAQCWQRQASRYGEGIYNATVDAPDLGDIMRIPDDVLRYGSELSQKGFFSARGYSRILRVARTIADMGGRDDVTAADVAEAAVFRTHEL